MLALLSINFVQIEKIAIFLLTLSILVVLHELGHFILARRNGVRVNEFAVGFGPKLLKWTSPRSGTAYAINLLPLGGYCAMKGEDGKSNEAEQQREFRTTNVHQYDEDNFQGKTPWQRLAIVVAGPVANFILAFAILLVSAVSFGIPDGKAQPVVGPMVSGMPADKAGIHVGDRVSAVNGAPVTNGTTLTDTIHNSLGKPLSLTLVRDGVSRTITLTPAPCPPQVKPAHMGCIGFSPINSYARVGVGEAVSYAVFGMKGLYDQTVGSLVLLVSHPRQYGGSVSGIVGIGRAATVVQDFGWGVYFQLAAVISFSLGVFNLLPFPALDGGRGAFIVAELLRGKPVDPEKEAMVHIAGFAVLMLLMIAVTYHDIANIISGKGMF
ncbi:MAG: M50 family metallopeptidase [Candidatus Eremiobacteraeota bacterium]|nr:M50 family metallopeptidase [Candidatus Eremiobacteraeota bacterium]